jgi:hypothetical protein
LSSSEQKELDAYLASNNKALVMRKQGQDMIKKCSEAVNAGRLQEADMLLKNVRGNTFLSAQDRQSVAVLSAAVVNNSNANNVAGGNTAPSQAPKGKTPADMLTAGKEALKAGNLDEAEMWIRSAQQQGVKTSLWETSPEKLLAEVAAARKKMGTAVATSPGAPADQRQVQAKQLCMQADQALKAGDIATAKKLTKQAEDLKANLAWFEDYTPVKMNEAIARAERAGVPQTKVQVTVPADPRVAVKEAQAALERGDYDRAEQLCHAARVAKVDWGFFDTKPEKVLAEVNTRREAANSKKAVELLVVARKNLDAGNFDEAVRRPGEGAQERMGHA